MNLPIHDIVKHLLVQVQHRKHAKCKPKEHIAHFAIAWHCLSTVGRNHNADRLVDTSCRQALVKSWSSVFKAIA